MKATLSTCFIRKFRLETPRFIYDQRIKLFGLVFRVWQGAPF